MKINRLYILLIALLSLFSCTKEEKSADYIGYLDFSVSQDLSIVTVDTKDAAPIYKIKVLNEAGVVVKEFKNHNDIKGSIALRPGKYTVQGISYNKDSVLEADANGKYPEDYEAILDTPVYVAEQSVQIVRTEVSKVDLVCTLSQVKVSVKADASITDNFKEIIVTVTNASDFSQAENNIIFSSVDGSLDKPGYFKNSGALKFTLALTNKDGFVSKGEVNGLIENVNVREHHILNLTLSDSDQGAALVPGVTVDPETNDRNYQINVNFDKKEKPVATASSLDLTDTPVSGESSNPVYTYIPKGATTARTVTFTAEAGVKNLVLMHNNSTLLSNGFPARVDLAELSESESAALVQNSLKWSEGISGAKEVTVDFTEFIAALPLGTYRMSIGCMDMQSQMVGKDINFVVIPEEETTTLYPESNILLVSGAVWAKHAYLYGMYNTTIQPSGIGFEYRRSTDSEWIKVSSELTFNGIYYYAKVEGLEPNTAYVYRTISDKEASKTEVEFITLPAYQLYNMGFNEWNGNSANAAGATQIWDNGNEGASLAGLTPTTSTTNVATSDPSNKYAVKLESTGASVLGMKVFAAGSHYVGTFNGLVGTSGAKINFGKAYDCKPVSLKGWYNYSPATIDNAKSPYSGLVGQSDICQIYVVLADWPQGYFQVNTGSDPKVLIDPTPGKDPYIIGYGTIECNTNTNGYIQFEMPIEYRNNRRPTTCVIVCSSSKYGDYFTGGSGSVLLVDEFEFTF